MVAAHEIARVAMSRRGDAALRGTMNENCRLLDRDAESVTANYKVIER